MAIRQWDPLADLLRLQERMNRLFEETLAHSYVGGAETLGTSAWRPATDLLEQPDRYLLRADIPGITAGQLDIQLQDGRLVLSGERKLDGAGPHEALLRVERPHGRFTVELALPPSVDSERISATHRNGVLEVTLPKRREEAARGRIHVAGD